MDRELHDEVYESQRLIDEAEREIEAIKQAMQQITGRPADPVQEHPDLAAQPPSVTLRLRKLARG